MADFEVGQKVTVEAMRSGAIRIETVEKVTHGGKRITLSDGSVWKGDGSQPVGYTDRHYTGPVVRAFRDEDTDVIARKRLVNAIIAFGKSLGASKDICADHPYTTADLTAIWEAIKVAQRNATGGAA